MIFNYFALLFFFLKILIFTSNIHSEECGFQQEFVVSEENPCLILDLETAISRALNYNRQLLAVIENVDFTDFSIEMANSEFEVQFTPNTRAGYVGGGHVGTGWSIGGGVDISKKFVTGTQISAGPSILKYPKHYNTELRAILTQPLLRGLSKEYQLAGIYAAHFEKRTACRNLYIAQINLIVKTVQMLYEVVKAEKTLHFTQESLVRIKQFFQAAKLKEKIGLSDSVDVFRAETELRNAEEALTSAQERLQDSEDVLRELLSLPLNTCIKVDVPMIYTPNTLDPNRAIELALQNRIEMDQSRDQWDECKRLSRVAKCNLYPELNLVLNYTNCGRDEVFTRACTRHRESTWGVGFTTTASFDALSENIAYQRSLLAVKNCESGSDQTETMLILEVKRTLRQLKRVYQRIVLQEEQIKTSEGELHLAKLKFDRGMADNFNVIQAEKTLRSSQQAYWSAVIEHIVGEVQLLAAIGLLIDKPNI